MTNPVRKVYEDYRAVFDSSIGIRYTHMTIVEKKPVVEATLWKCLDGPDREHWRQAAFTQYNKNNKTGGFLQPIPQEQVPKDKTILQPILAPKVKSHGNNLYEFILRMCANGSKQIKGIDFDYSWLPVVGASALQMTLLWAAVDLLCLAILDIENCFQNTLVAAEDSIRFTW